MQPAESSWSLSGDYLETCNCESLCPCLLSRYEAKPTEGDCKTLLAFHIDQGRLGGLDLSDLSLGMLLYSPGALAQGRWTTALFIDDRATPSQAEALTAIFSGRLGGPPAFMAALTATFLGSTPGPVSYTISPDGKGRRFTFASSIEIEIDAITGAGEQPVWIDNTAHIAPRTGVAAVKASRIRSDAFAWDTAGRNGLYAPFRWKGQS